MKFAPVSFILCLAFLCLASLAMPVQLFASDPATAANIFMYPKPYKMAELVLQTPAGTSVSLNDYRGRVVLLHFWSINCPACRLEEPLLQRLKNTFGPSGLEILAVNLVDTPQAIATHAVAQRMPFPVLFDGGRGFSLKVVNTGGKSTAFVLNPAKEAILEVPGFPTTYILDSRGSVVGYSIGQGRWDSGYAVGLIQRLLADGRVNTPGVFRGGPGNAAAGPHVP
jgi:thiol-disulfide isomerase/thioredoxin